MTTKGVYNLNTQHGGFPSRAVTLLLLALLSLAGCGKKCQQVAQPATSITSNAWRLVETTDRTTGFRKLNNFTFPVMTFGLDFTGSVQSVVNNQQFDSPLCNLIHKEDSENNLMVVQFSEGGGGENLGADETPAATTPVCPFKGTRTYEYKIGRELTLTDAKTGNFYRFVPFLGIVEPDKNCTF